ncbi:PAS domain-containing protein [Rhizobium sp. BK251]|uniref:PAS domain-containing protein n=1 Tax=Rhizobium sp. BK251 TaxID=2512125 RepID=UPI001053BA03|nr:PAS domain-containing protein [Rhizobium sp. BK251]TCL73900.1 PAS domain S-box-containing protein [Rhizobium sp. BK251]
MLSLFQAFSLQCLDLQRAIKSGDDAQVRAKDRDLERLIAEILSHKAGNIVEIYTQLQFVSHLIRHEADDRSCVLRHSAALSILLDRYFGVEGGAMDTVFQDVLSQSAASEKPTSTDVTSILNAVILDSLPDRVAVITRDYRYLYSNPANATYLNCKPVELIGRHVVEFVGEERFERRAKAKLDACLAGEQLDYTYDLDLPDGRSKTARCRMTPLRTNENEIIGVLIVLQDIGVRLGVLAA